MIKNKAKSALDEKNKTIRVLIIIIGMLVLFSMHAHIRVMNKSEEVPAYLPPDLSAGGPVSLNVPPEYVVYDFAVHIWQQINRWEADGSKDYIKRLEMYRNYLTPRFYNELLRDASNNRHNNANRTRTIESIPGLEFSSARVKTLSRSSFITKPQLRLSDHVRGTPVKTGVYEFSFRVVKYDIDRYQNPYKLALDGFAAPTKRVE